VNTYITGHQQTYAVGPDGTGGFVVVWTSAGSAGTDTSDRSIQIRRLDAAGDPVGGEVQVNSYTTGSQVFPSVASDGAGGFVVVWESEGSVGSDTSYQSIQAQRFAGVTTTSTSSTTLPGASSTTSTTPATGTTTTSTLPPGVPLPGRKLVLTTRPARPNKNTLALAAKDPGLTLGRGNGTADDPVVRGGAFTVASVTAGFSIAYVLAPEGWRYVGKAGRNKGYAWKSDTAPVAVVLRRGKLKIAGRGQALGIVLSANPNPVRVGLDVGELRYCFAFGGDAPRFVSGRLYRAKRAGAPSSCP
jgi:hypothetical protein